MTLKEILLLKKSLILSVLMSILVIKVLFLNKLGLKLLALTLVASILCAFLAKFVVMSWKYLLIKLGIPSFP
jgi:hypothetical protein